MSEFKLPAMGADMDEGTLLEWKVKPGETVKKGQVVAVVDTAKAAVDVEIWQDGVIQELLAQPGDRMPVGTVMARLLGPGEAPAARPAAAPPESRRMVSPAARKHAQEAGIDLAALIGTGPHGSVTLEDVERVVAAGSAAAPPPPAADKGPGKGPDKGADKAAAMRRAIAAAMARSKREIPHYYVAETIPLTRALAWLQAENGRRPMAERLLPAVLLLKAVAKALKRFPELNGFFVEGGFKPAAAVHLGVAVSLRQGGLIAPALLDADSRSLTELMQGLTDLVQRTRAGSLKSSEMSEPTITVTNLGDQGTEQVFGVIYPPQVALVGFGRIAERPWAEDGGLKVLPCVSASLAADHRVSDGHRGALFLLELKELLQHPEELDR